jgi:hypothetical protein
MNSKLLQPKNYSCNQSPEGLDDQQENTEDPSEPSDATRNRTTRSTWLLTPRPATKTQLTVRGLPLTTMPRIS